MTDKLLRVGSGIGGGLIFLLFCLAFREYPGQGYVYLLFTVSLNALLFVAIRKNRLFFDTFIGLFFWLGYWLKFSFRMAFMGGRFREPIGNNFDFSGAAYDHALLVTTCGVTALILVSFIRSRFFFNYPERSENIRLKGLRHLYARHRITVWVVFAIGFIAIAVTNAYLGIYQRGTIPRTVLPYRLGGIFTWLLLFGAATVSAVLLEFEISMKKRPAYTVVFLSLLETFFSNVSMLSRGMVLNAGALGWGLLRSIRMHAVKPKFRFYLIAVSLFILLFGTSIVTVTNLRVMLYGKQSFAELKEYAIKRSGHRLVSLVLDRWVGIEGTMAVSSYPELGWDLWQRAWNEKYASQGTSFYDHEIASSVYTRMDRTRHHFISLPGALAFFYYPGSYVFLFGAMCLLGTLAALIEIVAYKMSGSNVILASLLALVVASRYAHFGYVPGQSYLLFGTLGANVLFIYALNKLCVYAYKLGPARSGMHPRLADKQGEPE